MISSAVTGQALGRRRRGRLHGRRLGGGIEPLGELGMLGAPVHCREAVVEIAQAQATEMVPIVGLPFSDLASASSWASTPSIFLVWPLIQSGQRLSLGRSAPS